jgi:hypothetical protein
LETLSLSGSAIVDLDLTANTKLFYLRINYLNSLQSLSLNNPNLEYFFIDDCNNLSTIDVSQFPKIHTFSCVNNSKLAGINFGAISGIKYLYLQGNGLTSIDVSHLKKLKLFFCQNNNLTSLDVRNTNQIGIKFFNSTGNTNLATILVDDPNGFYLNTWKKDDATTFSEQ